MKFKICKEKETVKGLISKISLFKKSLNPKEVSFRISVDAADTIFIEYLEAHKPGAGAIALQKLCDFADENKLKIKLSASDDFGSSMDKLIPFYSFFGFTPVISRMERNPK